MPINALIVGAAMACLCPLANAAMSVLDSFVEGEHLLIAGENSSTSAAVSSAFGTKRVTTITRFVPLGTTVTSALVQGSGTLQFEASGTSIADDRPLEMRLHYLDGGPYSLEGYSAFELDVAIIGGTGNLIIELGSETAIYGPEIARIPINSAGTIIVPFSEVNFGPAGSLNSFYAMHFTFEAVTEEYALTLNEIRVVPEPSNAALVAASSLGLVAMRRRYVAAG